MFSLGYGYYNIYQRLEKNHLSESYQKKIIYNLQQSLTRPIYAKLEKNLTKRTGLGISIAYDQFSFSANADTYFEKSTTNGDQQFTGSFQAIPHDGTNNSDTVKAVRESYSYNSLSIGLRWNFYFLNKEKYQLYAGIGLGYKKGTTTFKTDIQQYFPDAPTNVSRLPNGLYSLYDLPLAAEITVGFRSYFYKNLGFYTEVGIAKSIIQGGLCLKIR